MAICCGSVYTTIFAFHFFIPSGRFELEIRAAQFTEVIKMQDSKMKLKLFTKENGVKCEEFKSSESPSDP